MSTVTIDRRVFPCGPVAGALVTAHAWAKTAPVSAGPADPKLIEDLVAANNHSPSVTYLDDEEARRAEASVAGTISRPWELWEKKALAT